MTQKKSEEMVAIYKKDLEQIDSLREENERLKKDNRNHLDSITEYVTEVVSLRQVLKEAESEIEPCYRAWNSEPGQGKGTR